MTRRVTLRQCAILAGGMGTRLGEITRDTPKPVLNVAGHPFLSWPMREFLRFGVEEFVILSGHLAPELEKLVHGAAAALPRKVTIKFSEEPIRAGTGGALYHAQHLLDDRFLMCNGDSLFATNLAPFLKNFTDDGEEDTSDGRVLLRAIPDISRYGVVELEGSTIKSFAQKATHPGSGLINAGIYAFNRGIFKTLSPQCSLEADILPALARAGRLRGEVGQGYFIDIGIPSDLARAQTELRRQLSRPAIIFDRDGVINIDHNYVGTKERWEWTPTALDAIRLATSAGFYVFIATNQSGIARGYYTEPQFFTLMDWVADQFRHHGGTLDDYRHSPFHPEATLEQFRKSSDCRKPAPGMLRDLLIAWEISPQNATMIGDQPSDMQAAEAAGVQSVLFKGADLKQEVEKIIEKYKKK